LNDCGLELREDLTGEEIARRYAKINSLNSAHSSFSHIALARVLDRGSHAEP